WAGVINDPVAWAKKVAEYGADAVTLRLDSAHPDKGNRSAQEVAATAKAVADATDLPLIILGCGVDEKDAEIIPIVAEAIAGKNALIGCATPDNYKQFVAAALANGHSVIASSPLDINLAKQLNILITEMNLPTNRIVIEPSVTGLGYGIEYAYSIMERARIGSLTGDKMLAMPVICLIGADVWKAKEAKDVDAPEGQEWGAVETRGILWEVITSTTLLQAGGSIFILKHPESMKQFRAHVAEISKGSSY
ncbi:MAG: acetyl-CoA decarbonylase/synthase complex subunit delta, partial [Clostridia bacterium]|nr:acetyl-CoA decarbonylase/synthase complex subunit delta [Clostridia bacterium]